MEVCFARTRFNYPPYADFFRLADLAGYPVCFLDEVDWKKPQVVISSPHNGEHLGVPKARKARSILWNIERPTPGTDYFPNGRDMPYGIDEVWCSDAEIARTTGARFVFLGGNRQFAGQLKSAKQWDLITLMAMFGRRTGLPVDLADLSWADVPGGTWGDERHQRLMGSRIMLSVHQDDYPYIEPLRYALAGCYALPLLAEAAARYTYYKLNYHFVPAQFFEIPTLARYLLKDEVRRMRLGAALYRLVCIEHPFQQEVEAAVRVIEPAL